MDEKDTYLTEAKDNIDRNSKQREGNMKITDITNSKVIKLFVKWLRTTFFLIFSLCAFVGAIVIWREFGDFKIDTYVKDYPYFYEDTDSAKNKYYFNYDSIKTTIEGYPGAIIVKVPINPEPYGYILEYNKKDGADTFYSIEHETIFDFENRRYKIVNAVWYDKEHNSLYEQELKDEWIVIPVTPMYTDIEDTISDFLKES
jgi:hypothetical protein